MPLRNKTNIPVIMMMGETGFGKTSLISIIPELNDITLYSLNNLVGIEEKDIINLLKKIIYLKELKIKKNNIRVFLDETNICNSFNLIS